MTVYPQRRNEYSGNTAIIQSCRLLLSWSMIELMFFLLVTPYTYSRRFATNLNLYVVPTKHDFIKWIMDNWQYRHCQNNNIKHKPKIFFLFSRYSSFSLTDSTNPFSEEDDDSFIQEDHVVLEADLLSDDWIQELPEDLDVCIAQRDFEGAVDLINKGWIKRILKKYGSF